MKFFAMMSMAVSATKIPYKALFKRSHLSLRSTNQRSRWTTGKIEILISLKYNNMIDLAEEHWRANGLKFDKVKYFAYG